MSKLAFLSSGAGVTVGAGTALVGVIAAIAYSSGVFSTAPTQTPEPAAVVAPVDVAAVEPEVSNPLEVQEDAPAAPRFDVVRVETNGAAMIAGSAEAGSTVAIKLNETIVAEVKADGSGKFASFVDLPESAEARVLTLNAGEGEISEDQVIITPTVAPVEPDPTPAKPVVTAQNEPPLAEAEITAQAVVETAEETVVEESVVVEEDVVVAEKPVSQSPTVLLANKEGVRVLQVPDAAQPDAMTALLGAISYDDAGDVALTGNAKGEFVRVYLNNRPVVTSQIAANGDWQAALPSVDTGIYTLRVDELDSKGDVVARVETPFKREAAAVLAAATPDDAPLQAITVQPGATLWAIARERYGSGTLYARVVEANADTIKNPDLIYPGQVFTVPD